MEVAGRLRIEVEQADKGVVREIFVKEWNANFVFSVASVLRLTIHLGVAALNSSCGNVEALIDRADQAMYQAKHAGN